MESTPSFSVGAETTGLKPGTYNTKHQAAETDLGDQMSPNIVVHNTSESNGKETEPFNGDFGLCVLHRDNSMVSESFYIHGSKEA